MLRRYIAIITFLLVFCTNVYCQNEIADSINVVAYQRANENLRSQIEGLHLEPNFSVKCFFHENEQLLNDFLNMCTAKAEKIGVDIDAEENVYAITIALTKKQIVNNLHEICANSKIELSPVQVAFLVKNTPEIIYVTGKSFCYDSNNDIWGSATAKEKWLAIHSAQMDAIQKINEIIGNIQIYQELKIYDFLNENTEIHHDFQYFLRNLAMQDSPNYDYSGIVEVVVEVEVTAIAEKLSLLCEQKYVGSKWKKQFFIDLPYSIKSKSIVAKGKGTIPTKSYKTTPKIIYIPQWANKTLLITGEGVIPKNLAISKALKIALERAKADGYSKLNAYIMDLPLQENTVLKNFIANDDLVRENISLTIKKAEIVSSYQEEEIMKIELELYLAKIWKIIALIYRER